MRLTNSRDIEKLIRLALRAPQSYRRLLLCAPFITGDVLRRNVAPGGIVRLPTVVVTRPETAGQLIPACRALKGPLSFATLPNLHAKIYIACGKDERDSVALVGSFNLTAAALGENYELGVRFSGGATEQRRQIIELERNLMRMARIESGGVNQ
jgi:hypothetical protein